MIRGWKKLSKAERRHVHIDAGCRCTSAFQRTIDAHAKEERETGLPQCWECKSIARKLGYVPEGGWLNDAGEGR